MARRTSIEIQIASPTACIVSLRGEHGASSRLGVTLTLAVAGGYRNVLVDLSECRLADGVLAGALRLAVTHIREHDGALELVVPRAAEAVRRALESEGLHRLLPIHETRAAGVASLASAEVIGAHREAGAKLHSVSARIDVLEAKTESGRARQVASARPGVTVVRAQIVAGPGWIAAPAEG